MAGAENLKSSDLRFPLKINFLCSSISLPLTDDNLPY
jgi:hypothetical protein